MIIGNLGRDPEMRYTPNGQAVTQFTVATNRNYRDQQGEWQKETEWFRVVVWGQQAERTAEYLRKGSKVYIEGRIQTRQWEDQNGQKRYTTELIANTVTNLERRPTEEGAEFSGDREAQPASAQPGQPAQSAQPGQPTAARPARQEDRQAASESFGDDVDDLPF